jgi:hypothetical protein
VQLGRIEHGDARTAAVVSGRKQRWTSIGVLALGIGLAAYALSGQDALAWRLASGLVALFCVLIGAVGLKAAWGRDEIRMFDVRDDGIEHQLAGVITWDEIEDVRIYSLFGQRSLGIWTHDPLLVAKRTGRWWVTVFARVNPLFGAAPISFADSVLPIDETYAEIQRWRAA